MKKTKYITIEGIDGSGKTSLVKNLNQSLVDSGQTVLLTKEFGSEHNDYCKKMREFALSDKNNIDEFAGQLLLASIAKQHQEKVIKANYGSYDYIISDRGPFSNFAYGPAHGIKKSLINNLFSLVYQGSLAPNLSIFIDLPVEIASKRRGKRESEKFESGGVDRIEKKGDLFLSKVRENFIKLTEENESFVRIEITEDMSQKDILIKVLNLLKTT